MPPAKRGRKKADEPDEPDTNGANGDSDVDEEDIEDQVEEQTGSNLNLRFTQDAIEIDLPRDGNERQTLEALAGLIEGMSS